METKTTPVPATEETTWTDEEFKLDLQRSRDKVRQAARESRGEFLQGRVEPFPEL